ncbi:hypothetical protein SPRG_04547 [Saprolegnia parasitica CBS 223.65]|uniref:Uncharacterized protein n=1 Tax=Saprolegnia parasitica (strain CBS 223.65) TaxID=695850 RepID=A0A067CVW6_SAPPC|nr:hypothetical protein SPRG_04547 [Saprolegnia parasitica CBS 223.65]KDO30646.1 hypothetical protein SPRG_04547 [Saprolegnia parasitica CBS 223.65]|eukprot:XP_012198856.1 hypothetical protein SPRG_04547 [Saprolegnia parasitica CBS 223.65]
MLRIRPAADEPSPPPTTSSLSWRRVLLTLLSYILFFTDVPRSGYGFASLPNTYIRHAPDAASYFGPYAYLVLNATRQPNGTVAGVASSGPTSTARVWSYKFDTTSIGLRGLVAAHNISGWDPCLLYESACPNLTLSVASVWRLLESTVDALAPSPAGCRSVSSFRDNMDDFVDFGPLEHVHYRSTVTQTLETPMDLCHSGHRLPFCNAPWSNLSTFGYKKVSVISAHIQARMLARRRTMDLTSQRMDVVVIDSTMDVQRWRGSLTHVDAFSWDAVSLLRVQNCSEIWNASSCRTIELVDYRYEAGMLGSNVVYYYKLVRLLRIVAQVYNIVRVLALFGGCYAATRRHTISGSRWLAALGLFFRIPGQVVIYGSWFPVILFVFAHASDATLLYLYISKSFVALDGTIDTSFSNLYGLMTLLTCHMRNVWVLNLVAKGYFYLRHSGSHAKKGWSRHLVGLRGYLLPLVSLVSAVFDVRWNALRSTEILASAPMLVPSSVQATKHIGLGGVRSVHATSSVPYIALVHCNLSMFSTSWRTLFLDRTLGRSMSTQLTLPQEIDEDHIDEARMLMNITWMTDPIEWLLLRLWRCPIVNIYRHATTRQVLHHPLGKLDLEDVDDHTLLDARYECIGQQDLNALAWCDRIQCH